MKNTFGAKIYIVITRTLGLRIGDVFEQTSEGFFELEKEPYRAYITGTLAWRYKRKATSILWPYETVAPYVVEVARNTQRH